MKFVLRSSPCLFDRMPLSMAEWVSESCSRACCSQVAEVLSNVPDAVVLLASLLGREMGAKSVVWVRDESVYITNKSSVSSAERSSNSLSLQEAWAMSATWVCSRIHTKKGILKSESIAEFRVLKSASDQLLTFSSYAWWENQFKVGGGRVFSWTRRGWLCQFLYQRNRYRALWPWRGTLSFLGCG